MHLLLEHVPAEATGTSKWGKLIEKEATGTSKWGKLIEKEATGTSKWGKLIEKEATGTSKWGKLIEKEFGCSKSTAKHSVFSLFSSKFYLSSNTPSVEKLVPYGA